MYNKDVRHYVREHGVFIWQVAKALGISDTTMTRRLRKELSDEDKQQLRTIIDDIAKQNAAERGET